MNNNFNEIENHILKMEMIPNLTKGMVRAYCISHNIKYMPKPKKEEMTSTLNDGYLVCFTQGGKCGVHPIIFSSQNNKYYIHLFIGCMGEFAHQEEDLNWLERK